MDIAPLKRQDDGAGHELIPIPLPGRIESRVEIRPSLFEICDDDLMRQDAVERALQPFARHGGADATVGDLREGVHAGVGTAAARHTHRLPKNARERLLEGSLNGGRAASLHLPAGVVRAVVREGELERAQLLGKQFGDLDGVGGRALAQIVAADPQDEAVLDRLILTDAADEHFIAA